MSSFFIIALVITGVLALLLVGYLNSVLERKKLEKARQKAGLAEWQQRLETLSETIPAQFLTVALKQSLHQLELHFAEQVLSNDSGNKNKRMQERAAILRERLQQADQYVIGNPQTQLQTEEQVKDTRFQLESLQALLTRAAQERLLTAEALKTFAKHIQFQLVNLYIEYFHASGQRFMQQGLPRQARLAFERGVKLLKRQNAPQFKEPLQVFEQLLEKANTVVLEDTQKKAKQDSALAGAMETEEADEQWQKKQIYD